MAVFKCKMCGGDLEITNETVAICQYCGTQQTLPKLDDDRRANMYDRANHLRRNNDYDKAMGIYEQILNEDGTDAEAYWSLVLCHYGIEYVEEPYSRKRIPTVNRAQFTSVFDDDNYRSALKYADFHQRAIYEKEAQNINEIQKGILAISQNEEPFDVFICYKESDNNGRRTPDSVLATELYHELTKEGFNVFFSRITLEDKLGSAYEPYIFAALNSAKVMVVLGTRQEYFKAVWVKNEWSRYLALIKQGQKKILIPAYKDMDPYDLPEEFSHLQAQDMSKLGFMQDLIRGIKKIARVEAPQPAVVKETVVATATNIAPLLKRAFMFLEDGEWDRADEFCEQVLNIDPEEPQAYLGKLMAELRCKQQENLKNQATPFDTNNHYQKVLRFADDALKAELTGYIEFIKTRNENNRLEGIYQKAISAMKAAGTENQYKEAAAIFETIPQYQDATEKAHQCREKAENSRKDAIYEAASRDMLSRKIADVEAAIRKFKQIPGWKDADRKIRECEQKLAELKEKEAAAREAAARAAKKRKRFAIVSVAAVCAIIAVVLLMVKVVIPNGKYNDAIALLDAGKYEEAQEIFIELNGYKDSDAKLNTCYERIQDGKYNEAVVLMESGNYEEAILAFTALGVHKNSKEKIGECNTAILDGKYADAVALLDAGKYEEAITAFEAMGDHKDSADKADAAYELYKSKKLKEAKVGDYVFFGAYEQDNNTSNGEEDIEWLVLEVKDGKVLVISKNALDCKKYNDYNGSVTWETCDLRQWLNSDFISAAFTAEEKTMIPTVTVTADKNPGYDTDPGNDTQDQVFLLSIAEANRYFSSDEERKCQATDYADANGAYTNDSVNCWWWLRSPGYRQYFASYVSNGGNVDEGGYIFDSDIGAVRPALWIDLNG